MGLTDQRRVMCLISGRVQGVLFRKSAQDAALALGLAGWARNVYDGRVQIVAEGPEGNLARFLEWCWTGSQTARVDDVEAVFAVPRGERPGFEIRPTVAIQPIMAPPHAIG